MKITETTFHELRRSGAGYCATCKQITRDYGVEPDADLYECPECEKFIVCGVDYALMRENIEIVEEGEEDDDDDDLEPIGPYYII